MKWFTFQGIMLRTANNINITNEHLHSLLKLLPMFMIMLCYDDTIVQENIPDAVGIMLVNCGKTIGCSLYNK